MYKILKHILCEEANQDGAAGGSSAEQPKTYTQAELDEIVAGLKRNNELLLDEKKTAAQKAKDAENARLLAEQTAAKNAGKMDEFEKTLRSQYDPILAEKDAKLGALSQRILGSERKAVLGAMVADFIDPSAADVLAPFIKTEFDGDNIVTKFTGPDGNVITTDPAQFKKYLREHKAFSHLMKADAATGGGAGGNKNTSGGAAGTMKRNDFESLSPTAKKQFMASGGTLSE